MKDLAIVFLSTIAFFLVLISFLIGIQENIFRLPVYFNPNGIVLNLNDEYKEFWGHRLSLEDVQFAKELNSKFSFAEHEVRIYDKLENAQIGKFFFKHIGKLDIIKYFLADIITSLIAFVAAVWFFYYIRDVYIFIFFISISSLILANFLYLAFDTFYFFVIFALFFSGFSLFNLSYRFRGKEIPSKWLIPQVLISIIMGFIVQMENENPLVLLKIGTIGLIFILFSAFVTTISIVYDIFRYHQQRNILKRKLSLLFSFSIVILVPLSLLQYDPFHFLEYNRALFLVFFLLFLGSFVYGTYRYSLIPVQVLFNPTIITFVLVSGFVGTYLALVIITKQLQSLHIFETSKYFNILYLFVSVVYLIQAKSFIRLQINYYSFKRNDHLADSLESISNLISSPISMKSIVGSINRSMMEALKVNKIIILIPGHQFANADLRNINFTRISTNSDIWRFFQQSKEVIVTSHLTYGVGFREILHNYLSNLEIQIAFPIRDLQEKDSNKAILLIGEKENKQNFSLGELRYIREVSRLASMLLDNYSLLADEIEKKKIMRKLHTASILDHTLNLLDSNPSEKLKIGYISMPAVEISGDYLDFITLGQDKIGVFLGDVSGHGLGTGYLVTAIKAITRDMILADYNLEKIFSNINQFLREKYGGNEFMTLIGGILDTKNKTFTYINAGHPGIILITDEGELIHHNKTQRVLGILNTEYKSLVIGIEEKQKLILYSDGITETFNRSDLMFGEESLFELLKLYYNLTASEFPTFLQDHLTQFRDGKELSDDSTFVAMELVSDD